MNNDFTYVGKVTIKVKNKPPVRKFNAGTFNLFYTLCKLLCQKILESDSTYLPCYMGVIKGTISDSLDYSKYTTLNTSLLYITSKEVIEEGSGSSLPKCVLGAIFPNSSLNTAIVRDMTPNTRCTVVLLDNTSNTNNTNSKRILAYAEFDYSSISAISEPNSQAVIEWELQFSNKENK